MRAGLNAGAEHQGRRRFRSEICNRCGAIPGPRIETSGESIVLTGGMARGIVAFAEKNHNVASELLHLIG